MPTLIYLQVIINNKKGMSAQGARQGQQLQTIWNFCLITHES